MGLFSNILEKLGLKKDKVEAAKPPVNATVGKVKPMPGKTYNAPTIPTGPVVGKPMAPVAMSEVDVAAKFESLAKTKTQKLDWKVSIVDLLKLLDIDSSLESRKALAVELGCPADKMAGDYAEMNVWLHKEVIKRIAANGGKVPANLLD